MKIVLLDRDSLGQDVNLSGLAELSGKFESYPETSGNQLLPRIADANIIISNKVGLDRSAITAASGLKLICVAATGTNNVDLSAASKANIPVCNVRGYATASVVQHVFGLLLSLVNRLSEHSASALLGEWSRSKYFCLLDYPFHEIAGKTMGIIGYGELGQGVARLAKAFGMKVLVANRPGESKLESGRTSLDELASASDIISLHCPLADNTLNLVNKDFLSKMKPSALLINTARGGIVDETALLQALQQGEIAGAALDVLSVEPPAHDHPLLKTRINNLIITPHIAWASVESRQRLVDQLGSNIRAFMAGTPVNLVN